MDKRATDGTCLAQLVKMAIPLCQAGQRQLPRTGPGKPPDYDDGKMAVLIMIAMAKKRKSKSAQYRFLVERRCELKRILDWKRFPARSTYFSRYCRAQGLFEIAIRLQGQKALRQGVADAESVAVDQSLIQGRGPKWHRSDRKHRRIPKGLRGVDRDSTWAFSKHHGWVQGYGVEVIVTATKDSTVFPLMASTDTASASEHVTFGPKIEHLPKQTKYVLADSGYDNNSYGDRIEYDAKGKRTGRYFLCPPNPRNTGQRCVKVNNFWAHENKTNKRRGKRIAYYQSTTGQKRYARRSQSVEPFYDWLALFKPLERWNLISR